MEIIKEREVIKRNTIEILELKSSLDLLNGRFEQGEKELMNSKRDHMRLSDLRNRKTKNEEK